MIKTFKMIQATEIIAKTTVENKINSGNQCGEIETIDFLLIQNSRTTTSIKNHYHHHQF